MEEKEVKLQLFSSQNELYMQILISLREKVGWVNEDKCGEDKFIVPFVLTCAAALECSLNDNIISHYSNESESSNNQITGYLSMNLKGKLTNIVPMLTNSKYMINTNHKSYQALVELITARNKLVHNKSSYENFNATLITNDEGDSHIKIPDHISKKLEDYTFGIKRPIGRFQDALEELYEKFFYAYSKSDFSGNDLIVTNKNA